MQEAISAIEERETAFAEEMSAMKNEYIDQISVSFLPHVSEKRLTYEKESREIARRITKTREGKGPGKSSGGRFDED